MCYILLKMNKYNRYHNRILKYHLIIKSVLREPHETRELCCVTPCQQLSIAGRWVF
jgi:hypothetical protein